MNIKRVGIAVGGFVLLFAGVKAVETVNGWRTAIFPPKPEVVEDVTETTEAAPPSQVETEKIFNPTVAATLEAQRAYIQTGKELIDQFDGIVQTAGEASEYPRVRSILPRSKWDQLPPDDQIAITYYTQSVISDVRQNPARFMYIPKDAPAYPLFMEKLANLCGDCWEIIVSDTDTEPYGIDESVVTGDGAWDSSACCQGARGSSFRVK